MWTLFILAADILLLLASQDSGEEEVGGGRWRTLTTWEMDTVIFSQVSYL